MSELICIGIEKIDCRERYTLHFEITLHTLRSLDGLTSPIVGSVGNQISFDKMALESGIEWRFQLWSRKK